MAVQESYMLPSLPRPGTLPSAVDAKSVSVRAWLCVQCSGGKCRNLCLYDSMGMCRKKSTPKHTNTVLT